MRRGPFSPPHLGDLVPEKNEETNQRQVPIVRRPRQHERREPGGTAREGAGGSRARRLPAAKETLRGDLAHQRPVRSERRPR